MIYQPRNVTPTKKSVDIRVLDQYFTMEISTNSSVIAYKLFLLDWNNDTRYTGEIEYLDTPLYNGDTLYIEIPHPTLNDYDFISNGNDYKWYVYLYQDETNMLITNGIIQDVEQSIYLTLQQNINILPGMYFKYGEDLIEILNYDPSTGKVTLDEAPTLTPTVGTTYSIYSNFIKTTPEYILYAREMPVVTITNPPTTLTTKSYTFNATYSQANDEPIISHRWIIGIPIEGGGGSFEKIYDSGDIYNANLSFTYDAFRNGINYLVELEVTSTYENIGYSGFEYFNVEYQTLEYLEKPVAKLDCNKNAIQIDWVAPTEFFPTLIDNDIYSGNIQPGTMRTNSFYIEKGLQNILPGFNIIIGNVKFTIESYDTSSGLLTIEEAVPEIIVVGEPYTISGETDIPVAGAVTLLRNNPYSGVNSVDTGNYSLIYENEGNVSGLGEYPENYNITLQFKPDASFFYGTEGIFNDINPIAFIESDASDGVTGMIIIFIHQYNVCAGKPQLSSGVANIQQLGANNTQNTVHLAEDINITNTPYIYFTNYGYIEKVNSYNTTTKMATLNKNLPFAPEAGEDYVMLETLTTTFYANPQDAFALQTNRNPQSNLDYRWIDSGNQWTDSKYWVEGGTGIERVAGNWWKLQITNNTIKLEKGGN